MRSFTRTFAQPRWENSSDGALERLSLTAACSLALGQHQSADQSTLAAPEKKARAIRYLEADVFQMNLHKGTSVSVSDKSWEM